MDFFANGSQRSLRDLSGDLFQIIIRRICGKLKNHFNTINRIVQFIRIVDILAMGIQIRLKLGQVLVIVV